MKEHVFEQFAGAYAVLAGISGFAYAVVFIVVSRSNPETGALLSALFLTLAGLFATAAVVGLYRKLKDANEGIALWAFALGLIGATGMAIHGGYDLANAVNPPGINTPSLSDLPNQVDPRGLLSFGVAGISLFTFSWLMHRHTFFPNGLSYVGYVSAALLIILYLGRLIVLDPAHPVIAYSAIANGFFLNPAWYIWLGLTMLRHERHG